MTGTVVLGAAHIHTPDFVKRILARTDVLALGVWDHDKARATRTAEALGCNVLPDLDAVWSDPAVEAVVICSETDRHETLVCDAAAAGKHLFVEKPLGMRAEDAFRMAHAIERAGVVFQTGYFNRGAPVHLFLHEQIQLGHFGKITRARHSNCHSGSLGGWFDTDWRWMADPAIAGCGAFGDLGTHSLDILMWLLGAVSRVTASIRPVTGRYGDCDESGEGLLEFDNGACATLAGGWVDLANPLRLLVSGTEGHAALFGNNFYFQSKHVEGADGSQPWTALPTALPHAFELFFDALDGKDVPLVTPGEAAERSAVMEALYCATKSTAWVEPERY